MPRYIDADALWKKISNLYHFKDKRGVVAYVNRCINNAPTADAKTIISSSWISVKDKLPETGVYVLAVCKVSTIGGGEGYYICDAFYTSKFSHFARNWDDMECDYNEENDEYYFPEGWWEVIRNWDNYSCVAIEDEVVYWMPLPEPPKEVRDDE